MVRLSRRLPDPAAPTTCFSEGAVCVRSQVSFYHEDIHRGSTFFHLFHAHHCSWHMVCAKHCWKDKWREHIRKHCRGNDIGVVPRMFFLLQRNRIAAVTFSWVHRGVWWAWWLKSCSPVEEVPRGLEHPRRVTATAYSQRSHSGSQSFLSVLKDSFYKTP